MTTEELIQRLEKVLEPKTTCYAKPDLFNPGIDTVVTEVEQSLWCLEDCRSALAELKRLSASLADYEETTAKINAWVRTHQDASVEDFLSDSGLDALVAARVRGVRCACGLLATTATGQCARCAELDECKRQTERLSMSLAAAEAERDRWAARMRDLEGRIHHAMGVLDNDFKAPEIAEIRRVRGLEPL